MVDLWQRVSWRGGSVLFFFCVKRRRIGGELLYLPIGRFLLLGGNYCNVAWRI